MSIKIYPPHYLFPTKILESYDNDFESYKVKICDLLYEILIDIEFE